MDARLYEGMFLIDAAKGGADFPATVQHIVALLERYGAQAERIEKWAENKLAYTIRQVDRGIYVLVYFQSDPARIEELRRDITLSEDILRALILRADAMSEVRGQLFDKAGEPVEPPEPEAPAETEAEAAEGTETPEAATETTEAAAQ